MSAYRIFFRDVKNRICGLQDFVADSEPAAIRIGLALLDVCCDQCASFELWDGYKLLSGRTADIESLPELNKRHQQIVLHTEEVIRQSSWLIARSHRLIALLDAKAKRDGG